MHISVSFEYTDDELVLTALKEFHVYPTDSNNTRIGPKFVVLPTEGVMTASFDIPNETAKIEVVPVNVSDVDQTSAYLLITGGPPPPPVTPAKRMMMIGQTRYLDYEVSPGCTDCKNVFPVGMELLRLHDSQCGFRDICKSEGVYDWSILDKQLESCENRNLQVLYTFAYTPEWAIRPDFVPLWNEPGAVGPFSNYPPRLDVFEEFFRALIAHVKRPDGSMRIQYFESWNETNSLGYWCGTDAILMEQQKMLWRVLQELAPTCLLTTPTPTLNFTTVPQAVDSYLNQGFQNFSNIVSFHGYCEQGTPGNAVGPMLDELNQVMAKWGCDQPLWDTEWNWTQGFADDGAIATEDVPKWIKDALIVRMQKGVACAIWFMWDNPNHCGTMLTDPVWKGNISSIGHAWINMYESIHPLPAVLNLVAS